MMYELRRDFYYTVYKTMTPRCYATKVDHFNSMIELRDFVYRTYRNGYTIEEVGMNFNILNENTRIFCVVSII